MANKDYGVAVSKANTGIELADGIVNKEMQQAKKKLEKAIDKKVERVQKYRKEASRLAAIANKRIQRLEKNNLQDSPAYRGYMESGGGKFSVRGKTHNQLQAEVARMNAFLNAKTSTIKGNNEYLKEIAKNTGIQYSNLTELRQSASKFFELSSKVEQYLRTVEDMASAIGYQKIWQAVNVYVKKERINLSDARVTVDDMIEEITNALTEHQKPERLDLSTNLLTDNDKWFKLPKD